MTSGQYGGGIEEVSGGFGNRVDSHNISRGKDTAVTFSL